MTENENIENVENKEENETEQPKITKKKEPNKLVVDFLAILCALFAIIYPLTIDSPSGSCSTLNEDLRKSLLQSLQSATAIYVAQQRVPPEVFSDFLITEGETTGAATITLQNISDRTTEVKGNNSTEMTITFTEEPQATYYLNGIEVTAQFLDEINKAPPEPEPFNLIKFLNDIKILVIITIPLVILFLLKRITLFWITLFITLLFSVVSAFPTLSKPAVYLYPEKPTEVNVSLGKVIDITLDVPKYSSKKGWNVLATPDGKLVDLQPELTNCAELDTTRFGMEYAYNACKNNSYPYIYWEGNNKANPVIPSSNKGWVVKHDDIARFLNEKLDYIGFNDKEKRDFLEYWVQKITALKQDQYFIYFLQTEELESYLPMTVSPQPDSINRFYIVVSKAKPDQNPEQQELKKFTRKGFTLVDWGGSVLF